MAAKPIDPKTKAAVVDDVRHGGLSVAGAAAKHGVHAKTVYNWLRAEVEGGNRNLILENNRLKKELEQAYRLLGRATAEMSRPKKDSFWRRK